MKKPPILGGILLVAGTTIGAGMLALPISTGKAGFFPAAIIMIINWLLMTYTSLLVLEVSLWFKGKNFVTLAKNTLGTKGVMLSWTTYLVLLYLLTTAYMSEGSLLLAHFCQEHMGLLFPDWAAPLPFLVFFGTFVCIGTGIVDVINRYFMILLCLSFVTLCAYMLPNMNPSSLSHVSPKYLPQAVSVISTSFGFSIIVPSLVTYYEGNIKQLKLSILIGSLIPLLAYLLWQALTLSIIPLEGHLGVEDAWAKGLSSIIPLEHHIKVPLLTILANVFSFSALVTSFLGVSLSLTDFLADGFKIKKTVSGKLILSSLTFLPPLALTLSYPRIFLSALEYAGGFFVVILLGLLPIMMVYSGRYIQHVHGTYRAPGGKKTLFFCSLFFFAIIISTMITKWKGL